MNGKPRQSNRRTVASSLRFRIEAVDLKFSNDAQRTFEMISGDSLGSVLVIPRRNESEILLLREYALGVDEYELGFVKGLIDGGETPGQAAERELIEEAGFRPGRLTLLDQVTLMPAYSDFKSYIFLAEELTPEIAEGDEPEQLEKVVWRLDNIEALRREQNLTDARTKLALFLLEQHIANTQS